MPSSTQYKITYLTSGAAGMFCGSCMNDNTLARGLINLGLDVQLVPTYTPIRTDEENVSVDQIFFGGINVYLQQKIPLFRHIPRLMDRFLDRPSLIRRVASRATNMAPRELGKLTVSMLKGEKGFQRKEVNRLCDWLVETAKPDLIVLSNILIAGCVRKIKEELKVPVVIVIQGDDIFLESLPEPYRKQALDEIREVAQSVDALITHSQFYADFMSQYLSIPRDKFHVTPLGIDVSDFLRMPGLVNTSEQSSQQTIGYFARIDPEKGLHHLVDAFIELRKAEQNTLETNLPRAANTKLKIAGWLGEHHREYAEQQFQKLKEAGLEDDFEYLGSLEREQKLKFFQSINLLVVPTVYREPKGLFALEAMAAGVPVIVPNHGAFPEMIADTAGGVLCEPGSVSHLSTLMQELLSDSNRRQQLGQAGRESVLNRRNAESMAKSTHELFLRLLKN